MVFGPKLLGDSCHGRNQFLCYSKGFVYKETSSNRIDDTSIIEGKSFVEVLY